MTLPKLGVYYFPWEVCAGQVPDGGALRTFGRWERFFLHKVGGIVNWPRQKTIKNSFIIILSNYFLNANNFMGCRCKKRRQSIKQANVTCDPTVGRRCEPPGDYRLFHGCRYAQMCKWVGMCTRYIYTCTCCMSQVLLCNKLPPNSVA